MPKPRITFEAFLKTIMAVFVILYAIFNFIGKPQKNAESIARHDIELADIRKDIREQEKDIGRINGKLESINNNVIDVRTDIRALSTVLMSGDK